MCMAFWLFSMLLFWSIAGFILYKIAEEDGESFLVEHLIIGIAVVFIVGLIPILNLIGIIFGVGMFINEVMGDDTTDHWWNKPAVKKTK